MPLLLADGENEATLISGKPSSAGCTPPRPALPPDRSVHDTGVSPLRRYSPHFSAGRVWRRVWRGGSLGALRRTALPPERSAVRLISVRRFVSVCAPMCVCVWSCLAFSMQVTPSPACNSSPHPRRHAGRPACLGTVLPAAARRSRERRGIQRSFCLP